MYLLYRRLLDSPEQPIGTPNKRFVWPWLRKQRQAEIAKAVDASADSRTDSTVRNQSNSSRSGGQTNSVSGGKRYDGSAN